MTGYNDTLGNGGIHHLAMKVYDLDASVQFYTKLLGFREELSWGEGSSRAILLDTGDGGYLELFAGGIKDRKPEGILLHFALRCSKVDKVIESVRAAGYKITCEPVDITLGTVPPKPLRIAFFEGPDGEVIELFHEK